MQYPVQLKVRPYLGKDPVKRVKYQSDVANAKLIENYLNSRVSQLPSNESKIFTNFDIAMDLNIEVEAVKKIISANVGPSNGITVMNV